MLKILFLDLDGVLNGHTWNEVAKSNNISRRCVCHLNYIITKTECKFVISSAWRYMIGLHAMTASGFQYMLRTHGVSNDCDIIGITPLDEQVEGRSEQISFWINNFKETYKEEFRYLVLDDMFPEIGEAHPYYRTNGDIGLTRTDAKKIVDFLNNNLAEQPSVLNT